MIAVIGVGNEFRRDDGAGPAVIHRLRAAGVRPGITLAVTDGEPARLIELWAGASLALVVDAVRADPPVPGRVHELDLDIAARTRLGPGAPSSHALGLGEAVELGLAVDRMPADLHIYSIEGTDFGLGPGLSPPVSAAIGNVADRITGRLNTLRT